jgi:4'-phosphopantetheinyl transferase
MFIPAWTTVSYPMTLGSPLETEIDVWLIDLDATPAYLGELLDDNERARASRFAFPVLARRFAAARGHLRMLLGCYLRCPPETITFDYGAWGKPALHAPASNGLAFNLAHSGGQALIAVGRTAALGIDIEVMRPMADWLEIANRAFAPGEIDALLSLPQDEQMDGFFACWTRKEAVIKFWGEGLSADLTSFEVSLNPRVPARLTMVDRSGHDKNDIKLHAFKTDGNTWAALAAPASPASLRFWRLR